MTGRTRTDHQRTSVTRLVVVAGSAVACAAGAGVLAGGGMGLAWRCVVLSSSALPGFAVMASPLLLICILLAALIVGAVALWRINAPLVVLGAMAFAGCLCCLLGMMVSMRMNMGQGEFQTASLIVLAVSVVYTVVFLFARLIAGSARKGEGSTVGWWPQQPGKHLGFPLLACALWLFAGPLTVVLWRDFALMQTFTSASIGRMEGVGVSSAVLLVEPGGVVARAVPGSGLAVPIKGSREGCCVLILRPHRRVRGYPDYQLQLGVRDPKTGVVNMVSPAVIGDVFITELSRGTAEPDLRPLIEELQRDAMSPGVRTTAEVGALSLGRHILLSDLVDEAGTGTVTPTNQQTGP